VLQILGRAETRKALRPKLRLWHGTDSSDGLRPFVRVVGSSGVQFPLHSFHVLYLDRMPF